MKRLCPGSQALEAGIDGGGQGEEGDDGADPEVERRLLAFAHLTRSLFYLALKMPVVLL